MYVKLCAITLYLCFLNVNTQKVPVTVYYESLCPDSKAFFTSQLYPNLQTNLSKWVNLTLVPYGKSNHTQVGVDQWEFTCHHGAYECKGNTIHACALHEIEKTTPRPSNFDFNPITLGFINCLMDKTTKRIDENTGATIYDFPINNCSLINHVQNYVAIENCAQHPDGSKYLAAFGDETHRFQENLMSVPTIVFNNKYTKEESNDATKNFVKVLCKYITEKPDECKNCGFMFKMSWLLLVLIFVKLLL